MRHPRREEPDAITAGVFGPPERAAGIYGVKRLHPRWERARSIAALSASGSGTGIAAAPGMERAAE